MEAESGDEVVLHFAESLQVSYSCETERGGWFVRYVMVVVVVVVEEEEGGRGWGEEGTVEAVSGSVMVLDFAEPLQVSYGCGTERGWWRLLDM